MKLCQICKSEKDVRNYKGRLTCGKHRQQILNFGDIRSRTLADGNTYLDKGEYVEVILYDRNLKERARAMIDKEDVEKVKSVGSWCVSAGYAQNGKVKTTMHIYLMGRKKGLVIDHINGNKLDNRKKNLRFVKQRINIQSWVSVYKQKIINDFKNHIAEGKSADSFFDGILKGGISS